MGDIASKVTWEGGKATTLPRGRGWVVALPLGRGGQAGSKGRACAREGRAARPAVRLKGRQGCRYRRRSAASEGPGQGVRVRQRREALAQSERVSGALPERWRAVREGRVEG